MSNSVMTKTWLCRSYNSLPTEKRTLVSPFLCRTSKSKFGLCRFDIYKQPFITGIVKERFDMCLEMTIDGINMVENERRTTQSAYVKELRFSKNLGWSQFAYLELRKTQSGFSIPPDFEIAKVACILHGQVFVMMC